MDIYIYIYIYINKCLNEQGSLRSRNGQPGPRIRISPHRWWVSHTCRYLFISKYTHFLRTPIRFVNKLMWLFSVDIGIPEHAMATMAQRTPAPSAAAPAAGGAVSGNDNANRNEASSLWYIHIYIYIYICCRTCSRRHRLRWTLLCWFYM
jgi:hypothetical protein